MPFKTEKSPYWQYNRTFVVDGARHRVRGSTGTRSKREAERIEEEAVAKYRAALSGAPARPVELWPTLDEILGTYCDAVARHQPSWRTTKGQAKALLAGLDPTLRGDAITTAVLVRYTQARRVKASAATVNRDMGLLKRALRYIGSTLTLSLPPIEWRSLHLTEPPGRVRQLTRAEEDRLTAALEQRPDVAALVRFLLLTGCRVGSACALEWRDVDFDARTVTFRTMKGGGRPHVVPMTEALVVLLGNHWRIGDRVFTWMKQGARGPEVLPFKVMGWRRLWEAAIARAGIEDFRRHDLRHTALSRITRTHGIKVAQMLADHSSIATTQRYAHLEIDDLRRAMEESSQTMARKSPARPKKEEISEGIV